MFQVHDRVKYLELLVNSLGAATGIDKAIVIFSHDFHSPEINAIIRKITFCRVSPANSIVEYKPKPKLGLQSHAKSTLK